MKHLGQCYVQRINKRPARSGTLWEGRFRSCIVCSDSHVLACYRYIELNPVRAGMVAAPEQYRWSSYAVNAEGRTSELLKSHSAYEGKATRVGCVVGMLRRNRGRPARP